MSPNTSLVCDSFLDFSYFMTLTLLRNTGQVMCRMFLYWNLFDVFLVITGVLSVWVEGHSEVSFSSHHNKYYQHDLSLFMLNSITWLRQSLSGFSIVRLLFFSLSHTVVFRRKPLCETHTQKWGVVLPYLRAEILRILFRILLHGRCFSYYLLVYLLFFFTICIIIQCYFFFSKFFHLQSFGA